jgi:hypothetical protein
MDPPYVLSDAGPGASHFGMSLNKFDSADYKSIVSGFDLGVFEDLARICDPFNLFCFCSNRQISAIMAYHEERGRATTLCVWHKTNAAPFANGVWRGDIEYFVHARASGATFIGGAGEKKKVVEHPIVQDDAHPTVKPLPVIKRLVGICSEPEQTILDPQHDPQSPLHLQAQASLQETAPRCRASEGFVRDRAIPSPESSGTEACAEGVGVVSMSWRFYPIREA